MSYSSEVLADSPLAFYRLGDASGTTMVDSSGNSHDGTYTGTPTLGTTGLMTGDADTAVTFDASSQFGEVASGSWANSASFTAEAWIKSSAGATVSILDRHRNSQGAGFQLRMSGGLIQFFLVSGGGLLGSLSQSPSTVNDNARHHIVGTCDGTNLKIYVDGALVTTTGNANGQPTVTDGLRVGVNRSNSGDGTAQFYGGVVDEAAYYGTALSAARILAHYTAGTTAGPTTVTVGLASETDTGLTAAGSVGIAVGLATETDSALPRSVTTTVTTGLATETDTSAAATVAEALVVNVGVAVESDSALVAGIVAAVTITAGIAEETDSARAAVIPNAPHFAQTNNRAGGRSRSGLAVAFWEPAVVPVPVTLAQGMAYDVANAYTAPVMVGTQPTYDVTTAKKLATRQRLIVGGKDVTFFRGVPTPAVPFQLQEPLTYGPTTIAFPQIAACLEHPGTGALKWLKPGATVLVQDVDADDDVVATRYRGIVIAFNISGGDLSVEVGGMLTGRAAMRNRQPPLWRTHNDAGQRAYSSVSQMGLRFTPFLGPDTGIDILSFGGMSELDYLTQLCALAQDTDGHQWTVRHNRADQTWHMARKDTTSIDATVYFDDARCKPNLRRDLAEEPNRVFMTGTTPNGLKVKNGAYPGLVQGAPPAFPGFMTEDDTGDGVTILIWRLIVMGYLEREDSLGGYDRDVTRAVKQVQRDAGITVSGNVGEPTWDALFDLDVTGFSLMWSQVLPMAERSKVRRWFRTGSGSLLARNPAYDPHELVRDLNVDVGTGFTKDQMREWAQVELGPETNWVGTIDLASAVIAGEHAPGDPLTSGDVMPARALQEGMNLWAPLFDGGTLFHVASVSVGDSVSVAVDTRARDAMKVWQVIARNRESRRNPAREFAAGQRRSSTIGKDHGTFDEVGGIIFDGVDLEGGRWTKFPVVAGQEGTIRSIRLEVTPHREMAVLVCGKDFSERRLNHLVDNPLKKVYERPALTPTLHVEGETDPDPEPDPAPPTVDETPWYEKDRVVDWAKKTLMLYAAGTWDQPGGYYPGRKTNDNGRRTGHPLTGKHYDDASVSYFTYREPVLYVAVWVANDCKVLPGRIMWNQLEEGS